MKCPACSEELRVIETRQSPSGTRRRRGCACGRRFTTLEVFVPDVATYRALQLVPVAEIRRLRKLIRALLGATDGLDLHAEAEMEPDVVADNAEQPSLVVR